jgi:hypothetical protein
MTISQVKYVEKLLVKFNMLDCKPIGIPLGFKDNLIEDTSINEPKAEESVYCSLIRGLMYLTST